MKVVRIITRLNIGGPARQAVILTARLNRRRFQSVLITGQPSPAEGDLTSLASREGVYHATIPELRRAISPWHDTAAFWKLLRVLWRERPAIVHTHMAKAGTVGRLAGMIYNTIGPGRRPGLKATLIHTFHGHVLAGYFPGWLSRLFVMIERGLARRTDCLIAVSQTVREELIRKGIGRPDQWRVVPVGLDLSAFAQLPFPTNGSLVRVGIVGRLVPIKNPVLFLEALARLIHQQPPQSVFGVVVGDGPLRRVLEHEAEQLGLRGLVQFTGWQRDVRTVYGGLEVACLTSWNEGTPVSLIEAMAAGRAVVATDVGGVRDLLGEAKAPIPSGGFQVAQRGMLVRAGDSVGLAAAIEVLACHPTLRRTLGEAARSYALRAFSQERLLQDISELYEQVRAEG